MRNGYTPSKAVPEYWENGTIPWFRMEDIRTNGSILSDSIQHITPEAVKGGRLFPSGSIILSTTATIGEHALIIADSLANQRFTNLTLRESLSNQLDMKFFYYYMFIIDDWCKNNVNVSGFASVDMKKLKKLLIPIPPMEVQNEVVEILDKFTALLAELKAELKARKLQYEYYRDQLLSFPDDDPNVQWLPLGEVCDFINGFSFKANLFKEVGLPVIRITNIKNNNVVLDDVKFFCLDDYKSNLDVFKVEKGNVLIAMSGATTGKIGYYNIDQTAYINQRVGKFIPNDKLNNAYLYHFLSSKTNSIYTMAGGGAQPNLSSNKLMNSLIIPIPPMEEQERIVGILDKFDTLTNSLTEGIPKEIEMRQMQYEYYRDALLSF